MSFSSHPETQESSVTEGNISATNHGTFHSTKISECIADLEAWVAFDAANQVAHLARLYHGFDPEQTTSDTHTHPSKDQLNLLFENALPFFECAGFGQLSWDDLHNASQTSTPHGINLHVDPSRYDAMLVLGRGKGERTRYHRPWWNFWRKSEYKFEVHNRVILMVKPNPDRFPDLDLDTDSVFLRLFRDVPVKDLEMILPGGRVRITLLDRALIYYPLIAGLGLLLYQMRPHLMTSAFFAVGVYALFKWTVAMALGGWSWRSYTAYRGKLEQYGLKLSKNLYLQTLDSDLGVFTRLGADIAEAERKIFVPTLHECPLGTPPEMVQQVGEKYILNSPEPSRDRLRAALKRWISYTYNSSTNP
jgi:hypothetical protein